MRRASLIAVAALLLAGCGGGGQRNVSDPGTVQQVANGPGTTRTAAASTPARAKTAAPACEPGGSKDVAVPILMYHVVNAAPAGTPYPELWVPKDRFTAQVDALAGAGYHGITLGQADAAWRRGCRLPSKPIVFSFDDGYASQSTNAAPVLQRHGFPGVLNLAIKNVGLAGGLSRNQIHKLIGLGWEIDSHTIHHLDVSTLSGASLHTEIATSRAELKRMFGVPVDFFCYPAGRYSPAAEAAVRAAGYRGATTTQPGVATAAQDPDALPRIRVNADDSAAAVVARVRSLTSRPSGRS